MRAIKSFDLSVRVNDDVLIVPTFDKGRRVLLAPRREKRGGGGEWEKERGG